MTHLSPLDQPLAVEDLADRAGMSRAAFKRHFGATPRAWVPTTGAADPQASVGN